MVIKHDYSLRNHFLQICPSLISNDTIKCRIPEKDVAKESRPKANLCLPSHSRLSWAWTVSFTYFSNAPPFNMYSESTRKPPTLTLFLAILIKPSERKTAKSMHIYQLMRRKVFNSIVWYLPSLSKFSTKKSAKAAVSTSSRERQISLA